MRSVDWNPVRQQQRGHLTYFDQDFTCQSYIAYFVNTYKPSQVSYTFGVLGLIGHPKWVLNNFLSIINYNWDCYIPPFLRFFRSKMIFLNAIYEKLWMLSSNVTVVQQIIRSSRSD